MRCVVCGHEHRRAIEDYISTVDTPGVQITLDGVAKKFGVPLIDLQVHALMHSPVTRLEEDGMPLSIAGQLKKGEANLLYAVAEEYYQTLKQAGKEVRRRMVPAPTDEDDGPTLLAPRLTKELVDLYIGVGNNLRQTVGTIVDMNQKLNDEADPALKALQGIIQAVRGPEADD